MDQELGKDGIGHQPTIDRTAAAALLCSPHVGHDEARKRNQRKNRSVGN